MPSVVRGRTTSARLHLVQKNPEKAEDREGYCWSGTPLLPVGAWTGAVGVCGAVAGGALLSGALVAWEASIFEVCPEAAITASPMLRPTNRVARIVVSRVRKSAAPRADIRPDGLPPMPSPPPSDFCTRMVATRLAAMTSWTKRRNLNMKKRN